MKKRKLLIVAGTFLFLLLNCRIFEYSPHQTITPGLRTGLTKINLEKLLKQQPGDTLRILHFSDTQRFYEETEAFVRSVNKLSQVDFIIHTGDITDFGLVREYEWMTEILSDLRFPYLTVPGIHDKIGNGDKTYERVFGALNYHFTYGEFRFIIIDANPDDFHFNGSFPDLPWLARALSDTGSYAKAIVAVHIPPFNPDFDSTLSEDFGRLLQEVGRVQACWFGHTHSFATNSPYYDIPYFSAPSMDKRGYWMYEFWEGGTRATQMFF